MLPEVTDPTDTAELQAPARRSFCGTWPFPTSDLDLVLPKDNARVARSFLLVKCNDFTNGRQLHLGHVLWKASSRYAVRHFHCPKDGQCVFRANHRGSCCWGDDA